MGDNNLETEYKFDEESLILYVKTGDDYNSLPKKVITSFKAINETFTFKYIFYHSLAHLYAVLHN